MTQMKTRQKILLAAIEAIEKNGIQNVTTRVIADEAGVNNAALHYYYGTKEELIERALESTLEHWLEDTVEILASDEPVEEMLQVLFEYMIEGVLRYPNLILAHVQTALMEGETSSSFIDLFEIWTARIVDRIQAAIPDARAEVVSLAVQSAVSTVLISGMIPEGEGLAASRNLKDPGIRSFYISYLVASIKHSAETL